METLSLAFSTPRASCEASLTGVSIRPAKSLRSKLQLDLSSIERISFEPLFEFESYLEESDDLVQGRGSVELSSIDRAVRYLNSRDGIVDSARYLFPAGFKSLAFDAFVATSMPYKGPRKQTENDRRQRGLDNARFVLKAFKNNDDSDYSRNSLAKEIFRLRHSWVALEYLRALESKVRYEGKSLFTVEPLRITRWTSGYSVFEQGYVHGPSLLELEEAFNNEEVSDRFGKVWHSQKFLKRWNLSQKDQDRLKPRIRALKKIFYQLNRRVEEIAFMQTDLSLGRGLLSGCDSEEYFEFQQGRNIFYDISIDRFVVTEA